MATATYTKTGNKASSAAKLPSDIFGLEVTNHDLLKLAYVAYLSNGRATSAHSKTRGDVRGGGKKPWRQKGTGRARFGSSRVPIWRGGGITFGPTSLENHHQILPLKTKRQALRQALSLKADEISIIETFECKDGKVTPVVKLLEKIGATGSVLLVVSVKDDLVNRATDNIQGLTVVQATKLNVFNVMNADKIIISEQAVALISGWLGKK